MKMCLLTIFRLLLIIMVCQCTKRTDEELNQETLAHLFKEYEEINTTGEFAHGKHELARYYYHQHLPAPLNLDAHKPGYVIKGTKWAQLADLKDYEDYEVHEPLRDIHTKAQHNRRTVELDTSDDSEDLSDDDTESLQLHSTEVITVEKYLRNIKKKRKSGCRGRKCNKLNNRAKLSKISEERSASDESYPEDVHDRSTAKDREYGAPRSDEDYDEEYDEEHKSNKYLRRRHKQPRHRDRKNNIEKLIFGNTASSEYDPRGAKPIMGKRNKKPFKELLDSAEHVDHIRDLRPVSTHVPEADSSQSDFNDFTEDVDIDISAPKVTDQYYAVEPPSATKRKKIANKKRPQAPQAPSIGSIGKVINKGQSGIMTNNWMSQKLKGVVNRDKEHGIQKQRKKTLTCVIFDLLKVCFG